MARTWGPGVRIRYAASDQKRQTIPWVEYRNTETGVTRTYLAGDAKPASVSSLPTFEMQCVDCHNRAAHSFELPGRAVDEAMAHGEIPVGLPFVKKTAVGLLKASYSTDNEATQKIPAGFVTYYQENIRRSQASASPTFKPPARPYSLFIAAMSSPISGSPGRLTPIISATPTIRAVSAVTTTVTPPPIRKPSPRIAPPATRLWPLKKRRQRY